MLLHVWRQDLFIGAGKPDGLQKVTSIQRYKCENCDETIAIPDCYTAHGKPLRMCLNLMSLGCTSSKSKVAWKHPIKEKAPFEDRKDYPASKQKKRR